MAKEKIGFDELPESKQYKTIDEAGIHRNFNLTEVEYQPRVPKTKKEKVDGKDKEVEIPGEFKGPWIKFTFQNETDTTQFVCTMFSPPVKEEDVKFTSDFYDKGVAIRKKTAKEQINAEFVTKFYFYEQLAKAFTISPDKINSFKKSLDAEWEVMFKLMFDTFFKMFPVDKVKAKPIDLKTVWNNNQKAKTSFLQLGTPSASNMVFAPYIPERSTMLSMSAYEQKLMKRQFTNNDRAPQSNDTEVVNAGEGFKPIQVEGVDENEALF